MERYTARDLWQHTYGDQEGYICVAEATRPGPGAKSTGWDEKFYAYPTVANFAEYQVGEASRRGRDAYHCAHLLTGKRRHGKAAPIHALYFEKDGGELPAHLPRPTALVESSPGRFHAYIQLTRDLPPAEAKALNKRVTYAYGGDPSGWDLGQMLRPPGTTNHKYADRPAVTVLYIEDREIDPDELDRLLPPAPHDAGTPAADGTPLVIDGDEPPVRLDAEGLAWWTGARVTRKEDGETDRSETLFGIGYELARGNASAATIAAAVAERDVALGFRRYTGRADGAKQYRAIAVRALARYERNVAAATPPPTAASAPDSAARVAALEGQLAVARARCEALSEEKNQIIALNRSFLAVLKIPDKSLGRAAVGLALDWQERRAAGESIHNADGQRFVHTNNTTAGRRVALSDDAIGKARKKLEAKALLKTDRRPEFGVYVDRTTGEQAEGWITKAYTHLPANSPADWLQDVAETFKETTTGHGGKREKKPAFEPCELHPEAPTVTTIVQTIACANCPPESAELRKDVLSQVYHDADWNEIPVADFRARGGQPQDAGVKDTAPGVAVDPFPQDAGAPLAPPPAGPPRPRCIRCHAPMPTGDGGRYCWSCERENHAAPPRRVPPPREAPPPFWQGGD